jgi:hypothetical protein
MEASFSAELVGKRCTRFHVVEQSFNGAIRNPYFSLYIETDDGASFCVNLDIDMLFWRSELPQASPSEGLNSFRLVVPKDMHSLSGRRVCSVNFELIPSGSRQLVVEFEGGGKLQYWDEERRRNLTVDLT